MRLSLFVLIFTLMLSLLIANVVIIAGGYTSVNQYFSFATIGLNILCGVIAIILVCYSIYLIDFYPKVKDITIRQWEKECSTSSDCVKRIIEGCAKSEKCSL